MRDFAIVQYARKIGKNTAEFTASDMAKFMVWWMKEPIKEDIVNMAKKYTTKSFQAAQTSRLSERGIESPINDGEEEIVLVREIVAEMGLTRADVSSLIWGLETLLNEYDLEENEIGVSFKSLLQGLKDI